jgi:hypothetical protein
MKAATMFHLALGLLIISFFSLPPQSLAQDSDYLEPSEKYSREELAQMLAPIALYPDALLSQVLMASTYPIEVIEADRWVKRNPELKGEALDAALLDKDWDPSVKAICHFPSILVLMSERITETTNRGNAFLAQEAEVMDMVQELRAKAYAQGNLTTTSEQKVIVEKETIIIEPADPRVVYVPYYDPFYIYGPWWYPAYPPYYWVPRGVSVGIGISYWPGFYFGFAFGAWSYFDWHHHHIFIDVHKGPRYVRHDRWISKPGRWYHAPGHRRGVAYRDKSTARKYGQYPYRSRDFRRDTRGFPELTNRDRDRDRRVDDRIRIDRDKGRGDRSRIDRDRQKRERVERDKQQRERLERERKERERADLDKQIRERAERDRQERERADRDKQQRERAERDRQMRQPADQERQARQRVERKQQQRSRDNVFNWVEDGRRERQSSERGRVSRQGRGDGSRGTGRSGGNDGGGRDNRGRNRR